LGVCIVIESAFIDGDERGEDEDEFKVNGGSSVLLKCLDFEWDVEGGDEPFTLD
jgi:hypothetical protein